jgi:hypothetical protein
MASRIAPLSACAWLLCFSPACQRGDANADRDSLAPANALWVSPVDEASGKAPTLRLVSGSQSETVLEFTLNGFYRSTPAAFGGRDDLVIPGGAVRRELGSPALPTFSRWLVVPEGSTPALEVGATETRVLSGYNLRPVLPQAKRDAPPPSEPAIVLDEHVYGNDAMWPEAGAVLDDTSHLRALKIVRLEITPLRHNPVTGALEVTTRMRLTVHHESSRRALTQRYGGDSALFEQLYDATIINYGAMPRLHAADAPKQERLLIVAGDRHVASLEPFVQWKRERGLLVDVLPMSKVGDTAAAVKEAIRQSYEDASKAPLTYVLLVGNATDIPVNWGTGHCASDSMYAMLAGDDIIADVLIGRIAADTVDQTQMQLSKILAYEMNPPEGEAARWLIRGMGISSSQGSSVNDDTRSDRIRANLLKIGFESVDQLYNKFNTATPANINAKLNEGRGWVTYMGHGSGTSWASTNGGEYSVSSVKQLANASKTPIIIDISCLNGGHAEGAECLAEAFMHQGTLASPSGTLAMFSASTSTAWDPSGDLGEGVAAGLTDQNEYVLGRAVLRGLLYMKQQSSSNDAQEVWEQYNLFGDPSLLIRSRLPAKAQVTHDPFVVIGPSSFPVRVQACAGANCTPLSGASIAILEGDDLAGFATSDAAGQASLSVNTTGSGKPVLLEVTGRDLVPYRAHLDVGATSCGRLNVQPATTSCSGQVQVSLVDADLSDATIDVSATSGAASLPVTLNRLAATRYQGQLTLGADLQVSDGETLEVVYADVSCDGAPARVAAKVAIDCQGPAISELQALELAATGARLHWKTDELATGVVHWGQGAPTSQSDATTPALEQSVTLSNLTPLTNYVVQIDATDLVGNVTVGGGSFSFTTPACTPSCSGRQCGPDGCGGSCGQCSVPTSCGASGQCVLGDCMGATYEGCCSGNTNYWCSGGKLTASACSGTTTCGWASSYYSCYGHGAEPTGQHPIACPWDGRCEPQCHGVCGGDDGCGGTCPACSSGLQGKLMINEILADPPAGVDVNGDGQASPTLDEFVELLNTSDGALDLSGVTLTDQAYKALGKARYAFPAGTVLAPHAAVVVWGSMALLGLNNDGDTLYLEQGEQLLDTVTYGGEAGHDVSLTRATDGDASSPFVLHTALSGEPYSPGSRSDGGTF